jgi:hypothetical protein
MGRKVHRDPERPLDRRLFVDEEQVESSCAVFCAGAGVSAGRFEACVAEELGDDDEVGAAAYERRRERVAQDVDGRVVVEAGGRGDGGDDVVRAADAEALAALVEKQRRAVFGAGPVVAFIKPAREGGAQLRVDWDVADAPRIRRTPLRAERAMSSTSRATISLSRAPAYNGTSASAWSRGEGQRWTSRK